MGPVDLLIVGAGPAGLAAAVTAQRQGLGTCVVDEQSSPGGQIWRCVETAPAQVRDEILGNAYSEGRAAVAAFRGCGARYEPGTQVWQIEPGVRAYVTCNRQARVLEARAVILATGAQERPMPFPGWTLPGVLTVGAAQILLKSSTEIPCGPAWMAGSGPLPLLYAMQLLRSGGKLAGYLDTTPSGQWRDAIPHLPAALAAAGDLLKGLGWKAALRARGLKVIRHVTTLEASGTRQIEALRYTTHSGASEEVRLRTLLIHEGIIPNIHPALSLGCEVRWSDLQNCHVPLLDPWGESSQPGVFIAGDGAGIGGARAAALRGQLAALGIAVKLGRMSETDAQVSAKPLRRKLDRELALRPFLDALFKPRQQIFAPADATIVCRCEEITARTIREAALAGQPGPNQVKTFTRAGMGPCQGRQCGYTVAHILAAAQSTAVSEIGFLTVRPPLKPVSLGELATLDPHQQARPQ